MRTYADFNCIGGLLQSAIYLFLPLGLRPRPTWPSPTTIPCWSCSWLVDLVFVVTVLMSLAAWIFADDAVSGEKEDHTPKLTVGQRAADGHLAKIAGGGVSRPAPDVADGRAARRPGGTRHRAAGPIGAVSGPSRWGLFFPHYVDALGALLQPGTHAAPASIMNLASSWSLCPCRAELEPYVALVLGADPVAIQIEREAEAPATRRRTIWLKSKRQRLALSRGQATGPGPGDVRSRPEAPDGTGTGGREASRRGGRASEAWDEANRIQGEKIDAVMGAAAEEGRR